MDPADVPDYYDIVKQPMDFSTIRKRLEVGIKETVLGCVPFWEFECMGLDSKLVKEQFLPGDLFPY